LVDLDLREGLHHFSEKLGGFIERACQSLNVSPEAVPQTEL